MFYKIANDHNLQAPTIHDPAQKRQPVAGLISYGETTLIRCSLIEPYFIGRLQTLFQIYWFTRNLHRFSR